MVTVKRTSSLLLLAAQLLLSASAGLALASAVPVHPRPGVPVDDLDLHLLMRRMGLDPPLPASWRAVSVEAGSVTRGPGGTLTLSANVGVAPMALDVLWTVRTTKADRQLRLTLADDDNAPVAVSQRSLDGPGRLEMTRAQWSVDTPGAYVVIGCVAPRMACVVGRVVVG